MIFNGDGALDPSEIWALIMSICTFLVTFSAAFKTVAEAIKKLRAPEVNQDNKIKDIESKLDAHEKYLANDKERIESIEAGNKVTQQAILALLSHAINGDSKDQLEKARNNLNDYLINR
jgi:hypothetical protein